MSEGNIVLFLKTYYAILHSLLSVATANLYKRHFTFSVYTQNTRLQASPMTQRANYMQLK